MPASDAGCVNIFVSILRVIRVSINLCEHQGLGFVSKKGGVDNRIAEAPTYFFWSAPRLADLAVTTNPSPPDRYGAPASVCVAHPVCMPAHLPKASLLARRFCVLENCMKYRVNQEYYFGKFKSA
jgi:hypothetical protein